MNRPNRRDMIFTGAAGLFATSAQAARLPIKKALYAGMLPQGLGDYKTKFGIVKEAGFTHIEMPTSEDLKEEEAIAKASQDTGLKIHGVMNSAHWKNPLNSTDPAVVETGMKGMRTSIRNAQAWGANTVLLVPAVVTANNSYEEAWKRSTAQIKLLQADAEKAKIIIGVENVWNKFLLSPLEMARFVDQFQSPYIKAYLDLGNMLLFGYPTDWVRTLGKQRIAKLHIKDFRVKDRVAEFVNLGEGDIDWKDVHKALEEIGYDGVATLELKSGDAEYLKDVSKRFDRILEGA